MLKLAGEGIYREVIESLTYDPELMTTGDKEAGTATIVPTARPAIGSAQYSHSLTLAAPSDARMAVVRIAARLAVTIAGLGTATHVYCSVRVDADATANELFSEDWTSTGAKLDAVDTLSSGAKATIFALLKDGAAHTFYFLFWANVASQVTVDVVQLWECVGGIGGFTGGGNACLEVTHTGLVSIADKVTLLGSGAISQCIYNDFIATGTRIRAITTTTELSSADNTALVGTKVILTALGTVATDLNYLDYINVVLRSEK